MAVALASRAASPQAERMPLPRGLARFNRIVANPLMRTFAGRLPPLAVVVHEGRRSGRVYRTPVLAFRHDGGFAVALTYGEDVDWLANLRAAGGVSLHRAGETVAVVEDRLVTGREARRLVPVVLRPALRALDVDRVLLLHAPAGG